MRIINDKFYPAFANLQLRERFFVELWESMTYMRALDSHRVRCLNARICARELAWELEAGHVNGSELHDLCVECKALLSNDCIIGTRYGVHKRILFEAIDVLLILLVDKKLKEHESRAEREKLRFAVTDLQATLEKGYLISLCEHLPQVIKTGTEEDIANVTGALLSDLVERGWHLETLCTWTRHFLSPKKSGKTYTFEENLLYMLDRFRGAPDLFVVTLRVFSDKTLKQLGKHDKFMFADVATIPTPTIAENKWAAANTQLSFATLTVSSHDGLSAVMSARAELDDLADILRFEFEDKAIGLDGRSFVMQGQTKVGLIDFQYGVPNPVDHSNASDFLQLAKDLNHLDNSKQLEPNSFRLLQSAFRHYRFGRDNESHRDKFINWWMGLESLAQGNQGSGIGENVASRISHLMLLGYLPRLLRDLQSTLRFINPPLPPELVGATDAADASELTLARLLTLLQSPDAEKLWSTLEGHPVVAFRGRSLTKHLSSPANLAKYLAIHLEHLKWHLKRLYRIRCCIVHGSPIGFRLVLHASNLEFYLKQSINALLEGFKSHPHIRSLPEAFERATTRYEQMIASLKATGATADTTREAVFADLVITEKP